MEQEVIEYLREFAASFDIIFVSDQADTRRGGVVTPAVRALLEEIAQADPEKIIWVDSRLRVERFRNMILKPNEREASAASIGLFGDVDYQRLRDSRQFEADVRDQSRRGGGGGGGWRRDGGSGVSSTAIRWMSRAPAIASRPARRWLWPSPDPPLDAARFGNLVASITVKKRGTGVASPEEVLAAGGRMSTLRP